VVMVVVIVVVVAIKRNYEENVAVAVVVR